MHTGADCRIIAKKETDFDGKYKTSNVIVRSTCPWKEIRAGRKAIIVLLRNSNDSKGNKEEILTKHFEKTPSTGPPRLLKSTEKSGAVD